MATQDQSSQKVSDLKLRQNLEAVEKALDAIDKHFKGLNQQSEGFANKVALAESAAVGFSDVLDNVKAYFQAIGEALALPQDALEEFVKKQTEAFENQATQSFMANLREIQKLLGLSNEEIRAVAANFGELGKKFELKSDLQEWFEARQKSLSGATDKSLSTYLDKTIPDDLGKVSDAFAGLFSDIAFGTQSSSEAFSAFGKSVLKIGEDMATELLKVGMRFLLFGGESGGGFFGSGGGLFGGLLGMIFNAKGNVFSAPALSAYSNSIVSTPTLFPFAHGIGLMGEAGPEAILPLTRTGSGDLGVKALGGGSSSVQVNINVENNAPVQVEAQQSLDAGGNLNISLLINEIDKALEGRQMQGRSRFGNSIGKAYSMNRANALYNS